DHFFFVNMPVLAYYAIPALESRLGWNIKVPSELPSQHSTLGSSLITHDSSLKKIHGHVLTFSPWLLRMEKPGSLEVLDERRIRVRAREEARYFEGVTGRTLLQAMGLPSTIAAGTVIRDAASGFTVTVAQADDRGVRELLFTFERPITSPNYHFLFGSPQFL